MTAHRDIVVCSLEDWDEVWRRNQFLVSGLLMDDPTMRVLFVEPPADPVHALTAGRRPIPGRGLRAVDDLPGIGRSRLWRLQPTKWLPRRVGGDVDARIARTVVSAARRLGFDQPLLWINDPSAASLMRTTGWPSMYDITDDWLLAPRSERQLAKLGADEADILGSCREVVVCSPVLAASKGERRPVTLIPNAVDVDRFRSPQGRPPDLPDGPQAVYVGTVHRDRIDVGLLEATARAVGTNRLGGVTLVGPDPIADDERETLVTAGVRLLGARPNGRIPGYLQHAQVLIVPHVVDAFTDSLDPIKLYEYLAVGRPIVSTPVAGFRDLPADAPAHIAAGEEFIAAVRDRLAAPSIPPGAHLDFDVPTWVDRVGQMREVIDRLTAQPAQG